ncbi:hypothetical protein FGB62_540g01 [Gracilaria domingensis]|nr:hypothetical protein FGB62_540g01 [Gracilaria domingensis]
MRKQTSDYKNRSERMRDQALARSEALRLLNSKRNIRDVARVTGVSKSTVHRIKKAAAENDTKLQHLLSTDIHPGPSFTLTNEECDMINTRLITAAERGFAVDHYTFKHVLSRIAADDRKGFKNGVPSDDFIRKTRRSQHNVMSTLRPFLLYLNALRSYDLAFLQHQTEFGTLAKRLSTT